MKASGIGLQNQQRLASLNRLGLLDTPAEAAFDRLTSLITRILRVPVALVSLVDSHRQYFKSSVGLPEPWATLQETPLSHSFCQYVVETGEPFIVTDAENHPLVCTNLAISELNIHAYLGVPLMTSDGMVLGSMCAIDTVPREWSPDDVALIRDLAESVVTEIELRRDTAIRQQTEVALFESTTRFAGAFRHASIGMALVGTDGRWLQVNTALCALLGYSEQELLTTTFQDVTHSDDLDADLAYVQQVLRGEITTYQMEKRYIHKDGHVIWIVLNVSLVRDMQGIPQYFVSQIQDITQRRQHEWERQALITQLAEILSERDGLLDERTASLHRTEALYTLTGALIHTQEMPDILRTVVETAASVLPARRTVLITVDMNSYVVTQQLEGGPGAKHMAPISFAELWEGLSGAVLRSYLPVRSVNGISDARESDSVQQRRLRDNAGSILVAPIQSQGVIFGTLTAINAPNDPDFSDADLALLASVASHAAIAIERTVLLLELQRLATTDCLTRLLNRRSWSEQCYGLIDRAGHSGNPFSLILLDVDYFKKVNDTYGHDTGDMVLQTISNTLKQLMRPRDLICRYGGEELAIFLPDTGINSAAALAQRVRRSIARQTIPLHSNPYQLRVTASVGVATTQGKTANLAELISVADKALYEAKNAGRNCVRSIDI